MASSLVLKQLLAFKSVVPFRPAAATISRFFSSNGVQNQRYSGNWNISYDMYINDPNKDMEDAPVVGPEKKDITAYMTVGVKGQWTQNGEVNDFDLAETLKTQEEEHETEDWKMKLKNGVLKVSLPKLKEEGKLNKFEIKFV